MANAPGWFTQLKWSVPIPSRPLTAVRAVIPDITGCYAFTTRGFEPLLPPWQGCNSRTERYGNIVPDRERH